MTRYHYIKKLMYLHYRLTMLSFSTNRHYDTSYDSWNSSVSYPPFADNAETYQENWDIICKTLRIIDGLEDLK